MDPIVQHVNIKFAPAVLTYDRQRFTRFLQQQDLEDIQIALDNWQWPDHQTQKRMLQDELERRRKAKEELANAASKLVASLQSNEQAQPETTPDEPSTEDPGSLIRFWQEHRSQILVGLIVGVPGTILGILALL